MRNSIIIASILFGIISVNTALADDPGPNLAHVVVDPIQGLCYAKTVPRHIYDRDDGSPPQQGSTAVYVVGKKKDGLVHRYNWYSSSLFIYCRSGNDFSVSEKHITLIRVGPWHNGRDPHKDHLAIAFYKEGKLVRRYSTLDIAGGKKSNHGAPAPYKSRYKNVSVSASHYDVFETWPKLILKKGIWSITAKTIDGRVLIFDIETGKLK